MRRLLLPALLAVVALTAVPAAATATCGQVQRAAPDEGADAPLVVGDSVTVGAMKGLVASGFEVDARICRPIAEGLGVLAARRRAGTLPTTVVVALGSNGTVTTRDVRRALRTLGRGRLLGLVTPRETGGAQSADQRTVRAAGRRWERRVRVLDWARHSGGHPRWLAPDGLHLAAPGARAFTRFLRPARKWSTGSPEPAPIIPSRR